MLGTPRGVRPKNHATTDGNDVDVDGVEHQALAWGPEIRAEAGAAAFRKGEAEHPAALRHLLLFQDDIRPSIPQRAGDVLEAQVPCVARSRRYVVVGPHQVSAGQGK